MTSKPSVAKGLDLSARPIELGICATQSLLECIADEVDHRRFTLRPGAILDLSASGSAKRACALTKLEEAIGDTSSEGVRMIEVTKRGVTYKFLMGGSVSDRESWGRLELHG